ncbi:site-specific DNA-methyltransferase [Corynebacterium singulare]|nr:site-specific DNA-methyltransferase [Corynebacterium singulare]
MAKRSKLELTWYNKDKALIPLTEGKYGYAWVESTDPRYCQTRPLIIDEHVTGEQAEKDEKTTYSERADLTPQDDNLLILGESGDVLEALTRVPELVDKYVGQVKCIYIDPPFNTAQTFANYEDNLEHSVWLTMMRDRLLNMRSLLSDDGSIWVHLDDVENHRMRSLLDEVFGAENFVAEFSVEVNPSGRQLGSGFARTSDTVTVYAKNKRIVSLQVADKSQVNHSDFPLRDDNGVPFKFRGLVNSNRKFTPENRPNLYYPLYGDPNSKAISVEEVSGWIEIFPRFSDGAPGVWRWGADKVRHEGEGNLTLREVKRAGSIAFDVFQFERADENKTQKYKTTWRSSEVGSSSSAVEEIKALFPGQDPFTTPKPERLLERIIHIATNPGDIVLDCFGGSGTTAAVAQKMGRRWVTCELVEDTFNRFTVPRLSRVITNDDPGGVTFTNDREPKDGVVLPDKFDTNDAEVKRPGFSSASFTALC